MGNLSSIITQTVGSSTAGVNLITAPNSSEIWTASTITKSTTTTAAELPLGPAIPTATKFALHASNPGTAYVDVDCPESLTQWCLQLGWFARASSGFTAAIAIASIKSYASDSDRNSDTDGTEITPRNATIQGTAKSFQTTFDTNGQAYYRITLSFGAQSGAWYSICQVQVGPGSVQQVTPVTDPVDWTPTGSWTSNATYTGKKWQVGSIGHYEVKIVLTGTPTSANLTINMPSNETIDTSALLSQYNSAQLGQGVARDTGTAAYTVTVGYQSTTSVALFGEAADQNYLRNTPAITQAVPFTFGSTDEIYIRWSVPISEWAGSGMNVGPGPAEEFVADDGSSDVFGPNGALVPNVAAGTGFTIRDIVFQYPPQANGEDLEVDINIGNNWSPAVYVYPGLVGTSSYQFGIRAYWASATVFRVEFGNAGLVPLNGLGATGTAWSSVSTYRWRVRKTRKASTPFALATDTNSGLISREYASAEQDIGAVTIGAGTWSTIDSKKYKWVQIGKVVTFWYRLESTTAASALTSFSFPFPSDCPTPANFSTMAGSTEWTFEGSAKSATAVNSSLVNALTSIFYNGTSYFVYHEQSSSATKLAWGCITYPTA